MGTPGRSTEGLVGGGFGFLQGFCVGLDREHWAGGEALLLLQGLITGLVGEHWEAG